MNRHHENRKLVHCNGSLTVALLVLGLCMPLRPAIWAASHPDSDRTSRPADPNSPETTGSPASPDTNDDAQVKLHRAAKGYSSEAGRKLWQARIGTTPVRKSEARANLLQMIAQIRSMKLDAPQRFTRNRGQEPNEPAPNAVEPNEPDAAPAEPHDQTRIADSNHPPATDTLKAVDEKSKMRIELAPDVQMADPFELGQVLYVSGRFDQAAIAYQRALTQMDANDVEVAEKRAWTLMQMGNCLRASAPDNAAPYYRRLINDHPDSRWTPVAKAMLDLLAWYSSDKPDELLKSIETTTEKISAPVANVAPIIEEDTAK